jgi:hypothetical protein
MMRCTIELIPGGDVNSPRRSVIGVIDCANVGGDIETGEYTVTLDKSLFHKKGQVWKSGQVTGFPRRRLGPYDLLYRALVSCGIAARNPT